MSDPIDNRQRDEGSVSEPASEREGNTLAPLPGEPGIPNVAARQPMQVSKKGLLAVVLFIGSLVAVSAYSIQRYAGSGKPADEAAAKLVRDKPAAAAAEPRKLDMPRPAPASAQAGSAATDTRIPALVPTAEELAEPIGVRRTGSSAATAGSAKTIAPEDAPVLLVSARQGAKSARDDTSQPTTQNDDAQAEGTQPDALAATARNLQGYQRQLQGLLDQLGKTSQFATEPAPVAIPTDASPGGPLLATTAAPSTPQPASTGLFGGQLQSSATPRVAAAMLGNRSLTLPKGTAFTCALKTKVISAVSGLVGCQVQRNVYSDDGRVLLIERGSHLDGEYRIAAVRPGTVRIPVLWTRIRTPQGVTVDIESPGTGALGESGIDGHVDKRWGERIGAAMLLSLIDDSVKLIIQNQTQEGNADTIVLPSTTANTSKLAEKVLDSTINIPPLIYQNQGGIVGIYVTRDVDFSLVYELKPVQR